VSEPFRVLISDSMSAKATEILRASDRIAVDVKPKISPADLVGAIGGYHGLLVRSRTKVTAAVLAAAERLRVIGRAGIGVDNIDLAAATERGVLVQNAPSGNSITTAEHAIALLFALARHVPQAAASMKAGKWEKSAFQGKELYGKVLGVVGLGRIGRLVADRARALGMEVVAHDPHLEGAPAGIELLSLDELLGRSDAITLHVKGGPATRGLLGAAAFAAMKPGMMVVNAARGELIDATALLAALESGVVWGAALDVFAVEPPAAGDALVAHPRVVCTPHLGASTDEAQEKVAIEVAEQLVAYVERGEVVNAVNQPRPRA